MSAKGGPRPVNAIICEDIGGAQSRCIPLSVGCLTGHTYGPDNYAAWHDWAEEMSQTHTQSQCPKCGFWDIWTPRANA